MSEKQKTYAKWTMALLALLGLKVGSDASGVELPLEQFEQLATFLQKMGAVTAVGLIWYLHRYWYPLVVKAVGKLDLLVERSDGDEVRRIAAERRQEEDASRKRANTPLHVLTVKQP
jgi:hypothetical protein